MPYGRNGDIPVPGDYDGDGAVDVGVFRPSTGRWHVRGVAELANMSYGTRGDIPLSASPTVKKLLFP